MAQQIAHIDIRTRLSAQDLLDLARPGQGWFVSVLMPFENSVQKRRARVSLLLELRGRALEELAARDVDRSESERLLSPVDAVLQGGEAEGFQGKGLAIYSSNEMAKLVLLPDSPAESAEVDRFFRLEPLRRALSGFDMFYLLGLDVHSIRLWKGDAVTLEPVSLEDMETNIKDALHFEESDPQIQFRSNTGSPSRNRSKGQGSSFYGVGGGKDERKKEFMTFFRQIDRGIAAKLSEKDTPLILAGVDYLMHLYREVNTYSPLSPLEISGNPNLPEAASDLRDRAFGLLTRIGDDEKKQALRTYRENIAASRTASGFTDVIPLAYYSNLTHLFIRKGNRQWGIFIPEEGRTELLDAFRPGAVDLVNLACSRTIYGKGKVFVLDTGEMPEASEIAGLCRT